MYDGRSGIFSIDGKIQNASSKRTKDFSIHKVVCIYVLSSRTKINHKHKPTKGPNTFNHVGKPLY